ncbi:TIGR01777 family oxidoreductase [Paenibacillus oenotherae]|uniref:TIGR01777 family oxidoreductase n=1 Tax=Paenibacillus oenotherae TaxID=1435645 RepID=A0ABS7D9E2_9BACL|nr:TIGR01777 family oxidoreductase [Paenibacillus oenotherae]MBW7476555.1 TIGR01777 family oxidoreductase [Paenibacillus oenotherae]
MKIAVTGGTGLVGNALVKALLERGDEVWNISRSSSSAINENPRLHRLTWSELDASPRILEGIDAIVNLAGESVNQRWNEAAKGRILQSRLQAAGRIEKAVAALIRKPEVIVNASGISIYGASENTVFEEDSPATINDFLSSVVEQWEAAADRIAVERIVKLRVSLVLANEGGAFPKMAMPYRLFAGGKVGSGDQWISWIHIDDITGLIIFCIDNPQLSGPVNASSPHPVTNDAFGKALAAAMGRPHWFPVPAFLMKAIFGEMSTLLLDGQRVIPRQAMKKGFHFRYPTIREAMEQLLKRHM